jgi:glucose/arabinose dehydrogenase
VQRILQAAAGLGAALLLAGCAAGASASSPSWVPKPSFSGEGGGGTVPAEPAPSNPTPSNPSSAPSSSPTKKIDPNVVATKLNAPDAIAILPDGTALVGERTTGRIVRVQPEPDQPVPTVRTLPGVDGSGDGGLLDLALSPTYSQDGLIYAYVTTQTDNRVVEFTLTGPVTPVLTGIPKGTVDNSGRLAFGADGDLYIGTSDAGRPSLAANPKSLAGKVLRVTSIGRAAPGNPTAGSRVYASGEHVVVGLCLVDDNTNTIFAIDANGARGTGAIDVVKPGASYGWPSANAATVAAVATLPAGDTSPGGCAVLNSTLYVSSLDAKRVLAAAVSTGGTSVTVATFGVSVGATYGRLRTVIAAPDGALWITTSNKDGHGTPVAADERVLRILPSGGAASNFPG